MGKQAVFVKVWGEGLPNEEAWCAPWTMLGMENAGVKDKGFTERDKWERKYKKM